MQKQSQISIFGTGSWGTALAVCLARNGHQVVLWGRDKSSLKQIASQRKNSAYLPGCELPENVRVQEDFAAAVSAGEYLLLAVPVSAVRELMKAIAAMGDSSSKGLICTAKGIEKDSGMLMHQIAEAEIGSALPTACLSGPSFAAEVGQRLPTAIVIASADASFARQAAQLFHNDFFRVYLNEDVVGVEVSGAVKNVIAIAVGISDGLHFGANTRAALITRGLSEIRRLALSLGASHATLVGLAGLGDLVLTCTDNQSRNYRFGRLLAEGRSQAQACEAIGQVVEGASTAEIICEMAARQGVEMPICNQVFKILHQKQDLSAAVRSLLQRTMKMED